MNPAAPQRGETFYPRYGKRLLDLALALPATVAAGPLLLIIAGLVRFKLGKPVMFRQARPGLKGKSFTLLKFRTMADAHDDRGNLLSDGLRMTRLGKILRSTSLDELPELFNVLRGDMSLVGPRPLLPQYLERYSPEQARRHEAKPGITGWAQINGRNAITWEDKFLLDVWYVDHRSLWIDLKIILLTLIKVIRQEGISAEGEATMPEFMGSASPGAKEKNA
jgi:lipopolysaccharide/colanic/teichoic acid biosynthesis glycosyltransferase